MSVAPASGRSVIALAVGALSIAAAVALTSGLLGPSPELALTIVAGAIAVVVFALEPFVGVLLLAAGIPVENLFTVAQGTTGLKLGGMLLFFVWAVRKLWRGESWNHLLSSPFSLAASLFIALALASAIWADSPRGALAGTISLCLMFGWSLLLVDLVHSWERVELLARVLVVGGIVAAGLTLDQALGGATRAGRGVAGGINATATMLLALLPLAFALFRGSRRRLWRFVGLAYVPLGVTAIAMTYSRMALLLLGPMLVLLGWQTLRGKRGRRALVFLGALGLLAFATLVPWERVETRLQTVPAYLSAMGRATGTGLGELDVYSGRAYHMRVAVEIARDHPIIGAGYNSYGRLFKDEYQFVVGGVGKLYGSDRSAHSSWFGILADLGIVGVLLWTAVLGTAIFEVLRTWLRTRSDRSSAEHALVQTIGLALLLFAVPYGFYLPTQAYKLQWSLFGLAVVVGRLARTPAPHGGGEPQADPAERSVDGWRPHPRGAGVDGASLPSPLTAG